MQFDIVGYSYDLPFPLMLPTPSFYVVKLDTGQRCCIRVEVGLGKVEFRTERALKEKIQWDDAKCTIGEVTAKNDRGDEMVTEVLLDENSRPLSYRKDQGFSYVEVILEVPKSEAPETYRGSAQKDASRILSEFLLAYRIFADDHNLPEFRPEMVPFIGASIGSCTVSQDGDSSNKLCLKVQYLNNLPTFQWDGIERHIKAQLTPDKIEPFRAWLQEEREIPEYRRLLLLATERGIYHKDYSLSIVFAQTAFEVFVSEFVTKRAQAANVRYLPLPRGGNLPVVDALKGSNLKFILRKHIPLVTSARIDNTSEFADWDIKAYKLRNDIVHAGRGNIAEQEAKEGFESVMTLIAKMESLI